ncbi:NAD(P)H-binding protein, partial [Micromonospora zhanjiangensis]
MRVVVAGGHGKIALLLERLLSDRGHPVVGLIRNPEHADDLRAAGAEPALCDLERASADELTDQLGATDADAVVFAAGAADAVVFA